MKFLLLLVAICGTVTAEIASSLPKVNEMYEDNEAVDNSQLVPDEIIKKCKDDGDEEAHLRAKLSRQKLTKCGSSLLHTEKLLEEVRAAILSNGQGMGPIVKKFCKAFQTSGQFCLAQYLSNLTPCLNETQKQIEELVVKMVETSWEYSCQMDAFMAMQFLKNDTISCLEVQMPELVECIAPYLGRLRNAGDPTHAVAEVLVKKECGLYNSVTDCIVEKLKQCPDHTAAEIVSGSFEATLLISPCADYVPPKITTQEREPMQQDATLLQVEAAFHKLEETIKQEHLRQNVALIDMVEALKQQSSLLKHMSTSLESVLGIIKPGRGKKW